MINIISKHLSNRNRHASKGPDLNGPGGSAKRTSVPRGSEPGEELWLPTDNNGPRRFRDPKPSFRDLPSSERQKLFARKLHLCCETFDFTDPAKNVKEKEIKRNVLLELAEYVTLEMFTEETFEDITKMCVANLFRTLPPSSHENTPAAYFDAEGEDEPTLDPAWPHLQIVYEILHRCLVSPENDTKIAKKYIDRCFILRLLKLFDSADLREREHLKTVLHRICAKFVVHRPFIHKAIKNIFYDFIYETEKHNGIVELLEVLASIINGFALPLRPQHKLFLQRVLIPMHKPKCMSIYHQQLSYCITKFVEKDSSLADTVVLGMLKYWPKTSSQKEVLFLAELEEVLEGMKPAEFQRCMVPVFRQISRCLNSAHFQVAERALFLFSNDYIVSFIVQNRQRVLPLIFPALEKNARSHWNPVVRGLTLNARRVIVEMDRDLVEECQRKFQEEESKAKGDEKARETTWKRLEATASKKPIAPTLPRRAAEVLTEVSRDWQLAFKTHMVYDARVSEETVNLAEVTMNSHSISHR